MSFIEQIETKLRAKFAPERLVILNESHLHAGHQHVQDGHEEDFDGKGETHLRIRIVTSAFTGMSRIQRHRAINEMLAEELNSGLHALALETAAPGEATRW